jgi:hypothetical protein
LKKTSTTFRIAAATHLPFPEETEKGCWCLFLSAVQWIGIFFQNTDQLNKKLKTNRMDHRYRLPSRLGKIMKDCFDGDGQVSANREEH